MSRTRTLVLVVSLAVACRQAAAPAGPTSDTESPKDSPVHYKVLLDQTENNGVEYHVLVADGTRHDDMEALLKYLYRYLMQRRGDEPARLGAFVYTAEPAFRTPPRSPVASVTKGSGDPGPSFEDKVPLEFHQLVDMAVHPRRERETEEDYGKRRVIEERMRLKPKVVRDDPARTVTVTIPYTEPGTDEWVAVLSFNQAMNAFTDVTQSLFDDVPDLKQLTYLGVWKDKEVVRAGLSREDYEAAHLAEVEDRIGQLHGRAFFELGTNRKTDAQATKDSAARIAKEYKALLAALKGKAKVDPALK